MAKNDKCPNFNIHAFRVALHELLDPNNTQTREDVLEDKSVKKSLNGFIVTDNDSHAGFLNGLIDGYKRTIVAKGVIPVWEGIDPKSETSHYARKEQRVDENLNRLYSETEETYHDNSVSLGVYNITTSLSRSLSKEKEAVIRSMTYNEVCFLVEKCRGKEFNSLIA